MIRCVNRCFASTPTYFTPRVSLPQLSITFCHRTLTRNAYEFVPELYFCLLSSPSPRILPPTPTPPRLYQYQRLSVFSAPCGNVLLTHAVAYLSMLGRADAAALYGKKRPRSGRRFAAGTRCTGAGQDEERSRTSTHGRSGRPRVLLSSASLSQSANR